MSQLRGWLTTTGPFCWKAAFTSGHFKFSTTCRVIAEQINRLLHKTWFRFLLAEKKSDAVYRRRPRRPPFLLVESDGIGVTSSEPKRGEKHMARRLQDACYKQCRFNITKWDTDSLNAVILYAPMRPIFMPERARALRADWAPGPGVFVLREMRSINIRRQFKVPFR